MANHKQLTLGLLVLMLAGVSMTACSWTNGPAWLDFAGKQAEMMPVDWNTSYADAVSKANAEDKILMLWFTGSDWCKFCTKLEDEVFHTVKFNEWYADRFVPVMLDYPKQTTLPPALAEQNASLKSKYSNLVNSYPTVLFVNTDGKVLGKLGYQEGGPENWTRQAENIVNLPW